MPVGEGSPPDLSGTTTVEDVVARIQNLLGTDAQLSNAEVESISITRYLHLHDTNPWSRRKREFTISTFAQVSSTSANQVTVTNGSSTVTANGGTPFTAAVATTTRQIQIGAEQQYFFINSRVSDTEITIGDGEGNAVNWPRATDTAATWRIFQTIYTLPTNCDTVLSLGANYPIHELDGGREQLDRIDPHRESTTTDTTHWLYAGENSSGTRELEIWPVPTQARLLRGQYLLEAPVITVSSRVAMSVPAFTYAVAADCYNMLHSKTGDEAYKHLGLFYEKKYTQVLNDVIPYEVSRMSPPRALHRRRRAFGRGTDWEVSHDIGLTETFGFES